MWDRALRWPDELREAIAWLRGDDDPQMNRLTAQQYSIDARLEGLEKHGATMPEFTSVTCERCGHNYPPGTRVMPSGEVIDPVAESGGGWHRCGGEASQGLFQTLPSSWSRDA
ncbi:hypothetical protein SEA_CLARK_37 [Gordonia phage Clark]|nr:hypothetical protein PP502_gp31 [Gordonia phage Beenie]YP_010654205.1 hypothetical protein PP504_gp38 [Gordonia phage Dolores]YP_010654432.1 hypothetical protein PP507_gp37 [Gordonia phage Clark]YP_010654511.1 hypothetical protein PP508_gp38 [Gordonia phage Samman98]YP_010654590.1 hypothetical protein PP509_gp38 [Gordonia phage MichaelScott]YP_010654899.1 hypothetical protein PP513_gp38 [Gordonia phage Howe]AZF93223.1 hypothetical protein SEA_ADORA_35 [Gordonia phage Adora]QDF16818.1 hypo